MGLCKKSCFGANLREFGVLFCFEKIGLIGSIISGWLWLVDSIVTGNGSVVARLTHLELKIAYAIFLSRRGDRKA